MIVVDANVLAAYAAGDSADIEALLVRDAVWIVPPIWLPDAQYPGKVDSSGTD